MREPIFHVPGVVLALIGAFVAIHSIEFFLSPADFTRFVYTFAFFPARYDGTFQWPGGNWSEVWTFVTYAFLHADLMHLAVNALWLLAFGSAVARRFGGVRFMALCLLCAVCGAALHLVTNLHSTVPMLGASAIVSGLMAAASRFIFEAGGVLNAFRPENETAFHVKAIPLSRILYSRQIVLFLGIWLVINFVLGISSLLTNEGQSIAWQAHIGGFLAGVLLFDLFDPKHESAASEE